MQRPARTSLRAAAACALLAAALVVQGCSNACLNLASQICSCLPDDGTRAACNTEASSNQDTFPVSAADAAYCQQLLDTNACDCTQIATPAGRAGCGISYPEQ